MFTEMMASGSGGGGGDVKTQHWTNSNPSTSFSAKTIPFDMTNVGMVVIQQGFSSSLPNIRSINGMDVENGTTTVSVSTPNGPQNASRSYNVVSTGIKVNSATSSDIYGIPIQIFVIDKDT